MILKIDRAKWLLEKLKLKFSILSFGDEKLGGIHFAV
tara:strand:- start:334 stop:444 length:111 start_codon:yes stop_codon:yes gene_type:complete